MEAIRELAMPTTKRHSNSDQHAALKLILPTVGRLGARIHCLSRSSINAESADLRRFWGEIIMLTIWLTRLLTFVLPRQHPEFALIETNMYDDFAEFRVSIHKYMIAQLSKGARGRPILRRQTAAVALAWHDEEPGRTWRRAADRFCSCPKVKHTSDCAARLKQDALRLKTLLRHIERQVPESSDPSDAQITSEYVSLPDTSAAYADL
jgi:hypothetical protein